MVILGINDDSKAPARQTQTGGGNPNRPRRRQVRLAVEKD